MRPWLCLIALLAVLALGLASAQNPTFSFPDQWEAVVGGTVNDQLLNYRTGRSTGYMYTDYSYGTSGASRVDEVWNVTSIAGTDFSKLGIHSDVHLFFGTGFTDPGLFYYTNATGPFCEPAPSGMIGQFQFTDGFVGTGVWNGVKCNIFQVQWIPGANLTLYVSIATNEPQAYIVPKIPSINFNGSTIEFYRFIVRSGPLPTDLFTPPSYCPSSKK